MAQTRILMVLTSNARMGFNEGETGLWFDSLATPFYAFEDAGMAPEIATIKGGAPAIDPLSLKGEALTETAQRGLDDARLQSGLSEAPALRRVQITAYDAIFLPAGRGAMWDFTACPELTVALEQFALKNRPIAAVGHGLAGLTPVMDPRGGPLTRGRAIACVTDAEDEAEGFAGVAPYSLETKLGSLGAELAPTAPFTPNVRNDGLLITGQNAASSAGVALALIEHIRGARIAA
jgi:putative intracellular protease/amidase